MIKGNKILLKKRVLPFFKDKIFPDPLTILPASLILDGRVIVFDNSLARKVKN